MRLQAQPGAQGDVVKNAVSIVFEQYVPAADGGDEQVLVAVVVNVRKRRGHGNPPLNRGSGSSRDVLKSGASKVAPKFVAAVLIHKIEVDQPISVNIRGSETAPMVVMN